MRIRETAKVLPFLDTGKSITSLPEVSATISKFHRPRNGDWVMSQDHSDEKLLFEISTPGARAVDLPPSDVAPAELDPAFASFTESRLPGIVQLNLLRDYT